MRQYTRRFRVRHYELDSFNHVNNAVYANYMQEAAIEASTEAGILPDTECTVGWSDLVLVEFGFLGEGGLLVSF